jgi:hypothetical protein
MARILGLQICGKSGSEQFQQIVLTRFSSFSSLIATIAVAANIAGREKRGSFTAFLQPNVLAG